MKNLIFQIFSDKKSSKREYKNIELTSKIRSILIEYAKFGKEEFDILEKNVFTSPKYKPQTLNIVIEKIFSYLSKNPRKRIIDIKSYVLFSILKGFVDKSYRKTSLEKKEFKPSKKDNTKSRVIRTNLPKPIGNFLEKMNFFKEEKSN